MATSTIKFLPSIVEQGTSGNWTYRKWSDGTAECWGAFTFNTGTFSAWGQTYVGQTKFQATYPTGLFLETPVSTMTLESPLSAVLLNSVTSTAEGSSKDHTQSVVAWRGTSAGAATPTVRVYAIGKWK